jgi:TonB family protein
MQRLLPALGLVFASACAAQPGVSEQSAPSASAADELRSQSRASTEYAEKLRRAVMPHVVLTEMLKGNPEAVVEVHAAADGEIVSVVLLRSSGVASWDRSVQAAIWKTKRFPLNANGVVPPVIRMEFRPNAGSRSEHQEQSP